MIKLVTSPSNCGRKVLGTGENREVALPDEEPMGPMLGDRGKGTPWGDEILGLGKAPVRADTKWSRTVPCVMVARQKEIP